VSTPEQPPPADEPGVADPIGTAAERDREIAGERGIPSVNRLRSMQSRVTNVLAIGFVSLMTLGLLAWYYAHTWQKAHDTRDRARTATQQRAQGEMKLPPLPRLQGPRPMPPASNASGSSLWGAPPPAPTSASTVGPAAPMAYRPQSTSARAAAPPDRRLTGPVLSEEGDSPSDTRQPSSPASLDAQRVGSSSSIPAATATGGPEGLAGLLKPTATPATLARVLPTQRLLLPRGWKIDCTLETAIDSSLQGLVTCVTPVDIFGADGSTVLLPRGTQLTGETRGEARPGLARVFVLWTEARTPPPDGVVAMLDSPGTDELGRSGLPGHVNRHFFERFGAALLTSVIEGAIQKAIRPEGGDTVILNPSGSTSVATEVLKSTVNIPPTIIKHNGERIQILVARDVDFRSVYELRPTAAR
jgi:type IV secretion system protein VirB10